MVTYTPRYLLQSVNSYFIAFSFFLALMFNFVPWGPPYWMPNLVVLVLLFWNIHQARRINIGIAFFLGLLVDVQNGTLLGEHALAYSLMSFFTVTLHRRELWLNRWIRGLYIIFLLFLTKLIPILIGLIIKGQHPDWLYLLAIIIEMMLWPLISWLLLLPQSRSEKIDTTRPL